ncbi:hypothetical protein EDB83DRAFT_2317357 [Lactarius deliciosus]|nr:hypothetical protein EDB83DRAFT_2317357 [Lactarius deliciosus]
MSTSIITSTPVHIVLQGLTNLQRHCPVPGKGNTFIYDAIFTCADPNVQDGVGSFRCYVVQDKTKKPDNVYELQAKVCTRSLAYQAEMTTAINQIIAFKPGRNVNSNEYGDDEIDLLGEIERAREKLHS